MRRHTRYTALAALLGGLALQACGGDTTAPPPPGPPTVRSVSVTPATHTFGSLDETVQLTARALDASGNAIAGKQFSWSSTSDGIATVSVAGLVTGVGNGSAIITATTDGVSGTATIDVGQMVTSAGGTVSTADDRVKLVFPAGAVVQPAYVTVGSTDDAPSAPGLVAGTVYDVGPSGTTFSVPVDLTIRYDPANLLAGTEETDLGLYKAVDGTWEAVSGSSVNVTDKTVTGSIAGLSVWGLLSTLVVPSAGNDTYSTQVNVTLTVPGGPEGILGNDGLGLPDATLTSYGGGSLGGDVTDHPPGSSVALAGGTLTVNADGSVVLESPTQGGVFTFMYRISNAAGSSDATVSITVAVPQGNDDAYNIVGNLTLIVSPSGGVLENDPVGSTVAEVQGSAANVGMLVATDQGGEVSVNADGSFLYLTPPGYVGTDTFTYSLSPGGTTATVAITIEERVWNLDETVVTGAGRNQGTQRHPFESLEAFQAVNGRGGERDPGPGDYIFMRTGTYSGGLRLLDGQFLIGEGATESFETTSGITLPPFTEPLPTGGGRPVITNASGDGITLGLNNRIIGLNVGDTPNGFALADNGSSPGFFTIEELSILGVGGALRIVFGGPLTRPARMTFDDVSSTDSPGEGLFLDAFEGTFRVNGVTTIDNSSGPAIKLWNSGPGTFDFDTLRIGRNDVGGITDGIDLSVGNSTATFTVGALDVTTGDGAGLLADNSGTVSIGGRENVIRATGGPVLSVASTEVADVAEFVLLESLNSRSGGLSFVNGSIGTFLAAEVRVTNSTDAGIDLLNTAGTFTINTVDIDNSATNAAGFKVAEVDLIEVLRGQIRSGSALMFSATRTPLNVTLDEVNSEGGSATAISLSETTGNFTVNGGTIGNKTGQDGSIDAGVGVYLNRVENISFNGVRFRDFDNFALAGSFIRNLTLRNSVIDGFSGNSAPHREGAISFQDLSGTALFDGTDISGGFVYNVDLINLSAGRDLDLTVNGGTIGLNDAVEGLDAFRARSLADVSVRLTWDGVVFGGARGNLIKCDARGRSSMDCTIRDNTFANEHPDSFGGGISIAGEDSSVVTYTVSGTVLGAQTFTGADASSIEVGSSGGSTGTGTIVNNVIGTPSMGGSGGSTGIAVSARGDASHTAVITDNVISDITFSGISVNGFGDNPGGTPPQLNVTITDNTIDNVAGGAFAGMNSNLGLFGSENGVVCFDVRNNTLDVGDASSPGAPVFLGQLSGAAHYNLPGYAGSPQGEFPLTGSPGTASTDLRNYLLNLGNTLVDGPNQLRSGADASAVAGMTGTGTGCP